MNMEEKDSRASHDKSVVGEAERWFVRLLDPDCAATEHATFQRWCADDVAHANAYRQVERLWSMSEEAVRGHPALAMTAQHALHAPRVRPMYRRWPIPTFAAAVVVLGLALLFVPGWFVRHASSTATVYSTAVGQQRKIALADGSSILLDTDSKVRVRYSDADRSVDLRRGRAQFSVHGNQRWPFVVHTQGGTVTAVGTKFQVTLDKNRVDVVLLEGRLAIATQAHERVRHATLASRQQLHFDSTGAIGPALPADMALARGWTDGKLFVHDWRLPKLLAEMNRYSTTQVVAADPALQHLRISGVFHVGDQETMVLALEQGWPVHATRTDSGHVVLSHK